MPGATGDVDDAAGAVLGAHLPVRADGEPERTDQVHLYRECVKQRRAREVVVAARGTLNALHEFGNALRMRRWDRSAGVVHQDVDPAKAVHDVADEGVDRMVIALVANLLRRAGRPVRFDAGDVVQGRARAPDDRRTGSEQFVRDADPDAAAGSGDDRDLAFKDAHHGPSLEWLTVSLTVTAS